MPTTRCSIAGMLYTVHSHAHYTLQHCWHAVHSHAQYTLQHCRHAVRCTQPCPLHAAALPACCTLYTLYSHAHYTLQHCWHAVHSHAQYTLQNCRHAVHCTQPCPLHSAALPACCTLYTAACCSMLYTAMATTHCSIAGMLYAVHSHACYTVQHGSVTVHCTASYKYVALLACWTLNTAMPIAQSARSKGVAISQLSTDWLNV